MQRTFQSGVQVFIIAMLMVLLISESAGTEPATPDELVLIATGSSRVVIDYGGKRYVLSKDAPQQNGISLVGLDRHQIRIKISDQIITLDPDNISPVFLEGGDESRIDSSLPIILYADASGFFFMDGTINGNRIRFLVDTGANIITLNSVHADQLGIDYQKGSVGYASTASGITALRSLKLPSLKLAHHTLYDVEISVIEGRFPETPLLGGSALAHFKISREGNRMELVAN